MCQGLACLTLSCLWPLIIAGLPFGAAHEHERHVVPCGKRDVVSHPVHLVEDLDQICPRWLPIKPAQTVRRQAEQVLTAINLLHDVLPTNQ